MVQFAKKITSYKNLGRETKSGAMPYLWESRGHAPSMAEWP